MFRRHRASKLGSRKGSGNLLSAGAYCSRRPTCTVNASLQMGHDLRCHVEYTGQVKHKTDEAAQRPIRADERAKLQVDLARDHCPSRLHSERLRQMDPKVFASGNMTGVGEDGTVFKQISYEGRRRLQSDRDLITSLLTKEETTLKSYIRQVSVRPMYVVAFTIAGVRLFHELAKTVPLQWDATGSVAWREGKK
ncbi:hypothetical protein HOLleu_03736 [Holothuria leucospilota]|uniref:Uncharacterized protein n=1 Tax=Holothuria leucospilota TaxID=206669 RepID=A0A9Q1CR47_HOLLE|nr:hypothetical protein HOLleu_03736 [Holothuria leucospilota]